MKLYKLTLHIQDTSSVSNVLDIQTTDALWDGDVDSFISPPSTISSFEIFSESDDDSIIEYNSDEEEYDDPIVSIDVLEGIDPITGQHTVHTTIVYSHEVSRKEALDLVKEIIICAEIQYGGWLALPSDLVMTLAGEKPVCSGPARLVHGAIRGW